jgi:thiosulfate dehydrogenase
MIARTGQRSLGFVTGAAFFPGIDPCPPIHGLWAMIADLLIYYLFLNSVHRRDRMGKFVIGLILGVAGVFAAFYVYFAAGLAPVGTAAQAMPFERKWARMALHAREEKEAPKTVPIQADDTAYTAGAEIYKEHCAVCHGLPGQPQTAIAKGMFPRPPKLMEGTGVTDDSPGETYWKVAGGIRLTGMPSFDKSLSTTQMWQVSVMLANADKLPQNIKDSLTAPPASPVALPETNTKSSKKM